MPYLDSSNQRAGITTFADAGEGMGNPGWTPYWPDPRSHDNHLAVPDRGYPQAADRNPDVIRLGQ